MKRIVLIVVGVLVAIAMIPIIVLSINRITQEKVKEEIVTFEVDLTNAEVTPDTYQQIYEFSYLTEFGNAINVVNILYNGSPTNEVDDSLILNNGTVYIGFIVGENEYEITIDTDDVINSQSSFVNNDTLEITFEVTTPAQVTGVGAALLGLVPILFVLGTVFSLVIFTKELE